MNSTPTQFFHDRFQALYPDRVFSSSRPLSLRFNTIRADSSDRQRFLSAFHHAHPIPWYKDAFILQDTSSRQLESLTAEGKVYIQSLSSMTPALILAPKATDRVLDMAAAPGSKTSQLAALMKNQGELVANDIDRRRLFKLKAVLGILGVTNVTVTSIPGQALWRQFPESFDKVLLDAPCSMEGTLFYPAVKKISALAKLQRWMLRSAVSSAKTRGEIIYSTCSMAPEENEEVIDWILEKEKGKIELSPISLHIPESTPGLTAWQGRELDASLRHTIRIPPTDTMEQFYVARFVKKASTVPVSITEEFA